MLPPDVIHQVLKCAPDAIVVTEPSGRIVFANSSAHRLFGYAAGSLAAEALESLLPARFRAHHVAHRERYAQEGRDRPMGADLDLSALHHDGTEIPVEISLSRVHSDTGPLMVAVIRDVSVRRRAEAATRARNIAGFDGYWETDVQGRLLDVNDAYARMSGYSRDQLIGMRSADFEAGRDADAIAALRLEIIAAGGARFETTHRRKDGSLWDAEVSVTYVDYDGGRLHGFFRDVTERNRAGAELARLNRLYAALSQTNQAIVHARTEQELFERLCEIAVEQGGFALALIGLLGDDGVLRSAAASGPARDYAMGITVTIDDTVPEGRGQAGLALRSGAHIIVNQIAKSESMRPWHERARAFGLASSAAFPLQCDGRRIGVLAVYSTMVDQFGEREVSLLDAMAADISFGLGNLRRDLALQHSQQQLREIETTARAGTFRVLLPEWSFWCSAGAAAVLGLPASTATGRAQLDLALGAGAAAIVDAAITESSRTGSSIDVDLPISVEPGATRFAHLYGRVRHLDDGRIEIGGTLKDISDRKHLEAQLTAASEAERHRLSIELHDNLGQLLFGTSLLLSAAVREAKASGAGLHEKLERTAAALDETMQACRTIAHGSTPIVAGTLTTALRELAARANSAGVGCSAAVGAIGHVPLSVPWALGLYLIAQEAVTNALRHAACRDVAIALRRDGKTITLEVRDDGRGFDLSRPVGGDGLGLQTMRYRAARAGGSIEFRSIPNRGTSVRVLIPVSDAASAS